MDLNSLGNWYNQMERLGEANMPFVEVDGVMYTPTQILAHARANDAIWQRIQQVRPDLDPEEYPTTLLIARIEQRMAEGRLAPIYILGVGELTPEQQLEEIRKGTPIGLEILQAEAGLIKELSPR